MAKESENKVTRIQDMLDVKEMATVDLINEANERSAKGNGEIILALHDACKTYGMESPEFEELWRSKTENEMRLHALRAELLNRDIDWVDCFHNPAEKKDA